VQQGRRAAWVECLLESFELTKTYPNVVHNSNDRQQTEMEREMEELKNNGEFHTVGCQYTIMYMAKLYSQAEFLSSKILSLTDKVFSKYEAGQVIEAFAIKTLCDWEWYCEKMICECLSIDTSNLSKHLELNLPKRITTDECVAYLNGLGYFDLKSGRNLKSVSKKILVEGKNPFVKINNDAIKHIDDYYLLRNYISHKSNKSKKSLMAVYSKYKQPEFVEVGEFLLSQKSKQETKLRIQYFEGSFWLSAYNILEFLYPKTYNWVMRDEEIYNDNCHKRFLILVELSPNKPK